MYEKVIVRYSDDGNNLFISMRQNTNDLDPLDIKTNTIVFLFNLLSKKTRWDSTEEREGKAFFTWTISKTALPYLEERFQADPAFEFRIPRS